MPFLLAGYFCVFCLSIAPSMNEVDILKEQVFLGSDGFDFDSVYSRSIGNENPPDDF